MNAIRTFVIVLGLLGATVFGSAFALSFLKPGLIEKLGKEIIRRQVEHKVHEKIDALDAGFLSKKAGRLMKGYDDEVAAAKRSLADRLPERIAGIIAEMADLDCECRKKIETGIRDGYLWQITSALQLQERLNTLIRTKYMETANQLVREFRIFTGTNAAVFAFLALAGLLRKKASVHLIPSAVVLLAAAGITASLYLFNQNWLHILVFGDYLGLGYVAYLSVAFALLSDVIFYRARITTAILNSLGGGVGIAPC